MKQKTDNYRLEEFGADILISGPGLTAQAVDAIKATLPAETVNRVIGWRSTGQ